MDKKKPKIYMKCPKWDICFWVKRKKKRKIYCVSIKKRGMNRKKLEKLSKNIMKKAKMSRG